MRIIIKHGVMRELLTLILFILVIFTPNIRFLPKYTWILALGGLLTLFDNKFVKYIGFYNVKNTNYGLILLSSMFFFAIMPFIHNTQDLSYIKFLIGMLLILFRNMLLVYVLFKCGSKNIFEDYCNYLVLSCCVCVIFTLSFIIFPEFKNFWMNKVLVAAPEQTYYKYKYRYSLSGFAAFTYSSIFSVAVIIASYLLTLPHKSIIRTLQLVLIMVGCFFYGRVTFLGIAIAVLLFVFSKGNLKRKLRLFIVLSIGMIVLLIAINYLAAVNKDVMVWKNWAFSFIGDLFIKGKVTDYSIVHMLNDMYFMPDLDTLILGDGLYTNAQGGYYMSTDVGYMRLVLYAGIIGMIVAYVPMGVLLVNTYKLSTSVNQRHLFISLFVIWAILEAKGDMYHRIIMLVYPMFLGLLSEHKKRIRTLERE